MDVERKELHHSSSPAALLSPSLSLSHTDIPRHWFWDALCFFSNTTVILKPPLVPFFHDNNQTVHNCCRWGSKDISRYCAREIGKKLKTSGCSRQHQEKTNNKMCETVTNKSKQIKGNLKKRNKVMHHHEDTINKHKTTEI